MISEVIHVIKTMKTEESLNSNLLFFVNIGKKMNLNLKLVLNHYSNIKKEAPRQNETEKNRIHLP